ncbi:MAG: hypothetical protein RLN75_04810 [Longimicrobiales bacterium]
MDGEDAWRAAAQALVVASGLWLMGLAAAAVVAPDRTRRFLERFASTARVHYTEQTLRVVAGLALVVFAPEMRWSRFFQLFGWTVLVTGAILMLTPWTRHRRFAEWAIPMATRRLRLLALGAFAIGVLILHAAVA